MVPLILEVPPPQAEAIAAEVDRPPGFDGDHEPRVRIWIGPSLEVVLGYDAADRLADALIDAFAADDTAVQPLSPLARNLAR